MINYLNRGISEFIIITPLALIIFSIYLLCLKFILKREIKLNSLETLFKFLWLLILLAILNITGIIGSIFSGNFNFDSILNETAYIQFNIFQDGISPATILNILIFIPFGFITVMVFKKLLTSILIGFLLSLSIEVLQLFNGRFVQLEDVLMNTIGMVIGCFFAYIINQRKK